MAGLLLGITLTLWGLNLLGAIAISNVILGVLALATGIAWILISVGVALPTVDRRH